MVENKSRIKWRPLVIGGAIILAIYIILASASQGGENSLFGFLLGGLALGFLIEAERTDVLIHGAILGVVTGLISIAIIIIQIFTAGLITMYAPLQIAISVGALIVYYIIVSIVGTFIGNFARVEYKKSE